MVISTFLIRIEDDLCKALSTVPSILYVLNKGHLQLFPLPIIKVHSLCRWRDPNSSLCFHDPNAPLCLAVSALSSPTMTGLISFWEGISLYFSACPFDVGVKSAGLDSFKRRLWGAWGMASNRAPCLVGMMTAYKPRGREGSRMRGM